MVYQCNKKGGSTIFCPNCGEENKDDANYCSNCGEDLNEPSKNKDSSDTEKEEEIDEWFEDESVEDLSNVEEEKDFKYDKDGFVKPKDNKSSSDKKSKGFKYYFVKVIFILLALFIPPLGAIIVFKSNKFSKIGKGVSTAWAVIFIGALIFAPENGDVENGDVVEQEEVVEKQATEEDRAEDLLYTDKGLAEVDELVDPEAEQGMLHKLIHGEINFREPFVKKWNHELEKIQDDVPEEYEDVLDKNWWTWLDLSEGDIEPRNAPGWSDVPGDIYDTTFGSNIEVDMQIQHPPAQEAAEDEPDLNKYRLVVELVEDLSEVNSTDQFLSRRRQAVQTMDLALRTVFGTNNYNRQGIYNYISDFEEDQWNIGEINLNFKHDEWGYYIDEDYDKYNIGMEVDETGEYESIFSIIVDFELN